MKRTKKILNQEGQALFEFLVFVPLMFMLTSMIITVSNAINGSINQQKIVRSYFYHLIQNDSNAPNERILGLYRGDGVQFSSMMAIGWRQSRQGARPVAPCYGFQSFFKGDIKETCAPGNSGSTTQFIRVKTAYGICSTTYLISNTYNVDLANSAQTPDPNLRAKVAGCLNQ